MQRTATILPAETVKLALWLTLVKSTSIWGGLGATETQNVIPELHTKLFLEKRKSMFNGERK